MGNFCSCFDVDDHLENAHNANNGNWLIPNLYNKIANGNGETNPSPQVAPGAVNGVQLTENTQSGISTSSTSTSTSTATTTTVTTTKTTQSSSVPSLIEKEIGGFRYIYASSIDEEECPTCLEEYTPENPKIKTKCSHEYHLACLYEWLERSQTCPVCNRVMEFDDL